MTDSKNPLLAKFEQALENLLGSDGHVRTVKAKKNIVSLFFLRGITSAVNFFLVPMTLHYLNPTKYGIWLTLSSMVAWVSFMDVGLGNGMRNKFAEAIAKNDRDLARSYVSTTYAVISIIMIGVVILFLAVNPFLHWSGILNTSPEMESELSSLAVLMFVLFALRLIFGLIGTLLIAFQRPGMSSFLEAIISILSLSVVYILTKTTTGSLFWLGGSISIISAGVPLLANIWYFNGRYRWFAPTISSIDTRHARELLSLGTQFFVLQLSGLVMYSTANIIITQLFGPSGVTPYNIAYKLFGIPLMAFLIILTPFLTAVTDAYVRGEIDWIRRAMKKLIKLWLVLGVGLVILIVFANRLYGLWVGKDIVVPFSLSIFMGVYAMAFAWSNIIGYFISGTGKLRLQIWISPLASVLNIPLAIFLAKDLNLNTTGVILATCLCLLPGCVILPFQLKRILNGTAVGIWAK